MLNQTTSQVLDGQFKTYRDEQRMQEGRLPPLIGLKANLAQEIEEVERLGADPTKFTGAKAKILKNNAYLRSLKFSGVMDKFLTIKSSGTAHKKVRLAYYMVPVFIFTGIAFSHFLQVSFGVYLKYQALVDRFHKKKVDDKYALLTA
jgi:hypothetical protein